MTTTLTKLPGSKWWVETDDNTSEIVGTYNKANITADIQAINETLALNPDPDQEASDYVDLLAAIANKWTDEKRARILAMLERMRNEYKVSRKSIEIAGLIAKRDGLIALRDRLV